MTIEIEKRIFCRCDFVEKIWEVSLQCLFIIPTFLRFLFLILSPSETSKIGDDTCHGFFGSTVKERGPSVAHRPLFHGSSNRRFKTPTTDRERTIR